MSPRAISMRPSLSRFSLGARGPASSSTHGAALFRSVQGSACGIARAKGRRALSGTTPRRADFSHLVIGGGVVGTAVAAELQREGRSVVLLEQHLQLGMETTLRNSEVIHAGLYYPVDSLKARLCVRGKQLMYERLDARAVPFARCGKWVVAQTERDHQYLARLEENARALGVPTARLTAAQCHAIHPRIRAAHGALDSPSTGIVSAHHLTAWLEAQFEDRGGTVLLGTRVEWLEREAGLLQFRARCTDAAGERFEITADCVVNAAGLHAHSIASMVLPNPVRYYYAKGSYFSYAPDPAAAPSSVLGPITTRLIYPCPSPDAASLGTHLTLDLSGSVRFGPDLEWVDATDARDLDYSVGSANTAAAHRAIATYFPEIRAEDLQPLYSGVRPKLAPQGEPSSNDFHISEDLPGFYNLLGIESPGLTSSMAIGEYVERMM